MTVLRVEALSKRLGGQSVLRGIDLTVPSGAVVALLGDSGCGKTTLLRAIAGFEPADTGRITLDDRVLDGDGASVPAEKRRIGYVPQEGTLFPHLTVAGNVGFGLTRRDRRGTRVAEMLGLTGLTGLEDRFPHQLSGGQQQRTALARALATQPGLVLLDEPFNALDLTLRRAVCEDVVALLRKVGSSVVLVTHDPQEAFASADLMAVMRDGQVAQFGTPDSIYADPIDPGIARLTGRCVFLPAQVEGGQAQTALGRLPMTASSAATGTQAMLRAEQLVLVGPGAGVPGRVIGRAFRGDHVLVSVQVGDAAFPVQTAPEAVAADTVQLGVAGRCVVYRV